MERGSILSCDMAHPARGVSMPEILVIICIVSILIAIAAPNLNYAIQQIRHKQVAQTLLLGMVQARSEAIKRNSHVALCKSGNGLTCSKNRGWNQGWIIFHDANNSGDREESEELISKYSEREPSALILSNGNISEYVSFNSMGYSRLLGGGFQAGTFRICPLNVNFQEAYSVILNSLGRVRIETTAALECSGS
jgi:type IV fimbrial biogenesis protein FimT